MAMPKNKKDKEPTVKPSAEFMRDIQAELNEDGSSVIGGAQDRDSGKYVICVHVPASALEDGVGPEIFPTLEHNKYYVAFSTELIYIKSEEINKKYSTNDEKNYALNDWLMKFIPDIFQKIEKMEPQNF